jgi:hypothetical protein
VRKGPFDIVGRPLCAQAGHARRARRAAAWDGRAKSPHARRARRAAAWDGRAKSPHARRARRAAVWDGRAKSPHARRARRAAAAAVDSSGSRRNRFRPQDRRELTGLPGYSGSNPANPFDEILALRSVAWPVIVVDGDDGPGWSAVSPPNRPSLFRFAPVRRIGPPHRDGSIDPALLYLRFRSLSSQKVF